MRQEGVSKDNKHKRGVGAINQVGRSDTEAKQANHCDTVPVLQCFLLAAAAVVFVAETPCARERTCMDVYVRISKLMKVAICL